MFRDGLVKQVTEKNQRTKIYGNVKPLNNCFANGSWPKDDCCKIPTKAGLRNWLLFQFGIWSKRILIRRYLLTLLCRNETIEILGSI
ncbi:hypothetical protein RCL_jg8630.t1 [Rhizophagus clarus]|uniref:Uncharacterized protein n=1 Tax=Rhizophagus clarus TaxID=94130 RepID=A0A8H3M4J3_9GLOM|nr:hypothetical protein RCL_jg8630.t1 [Rhizophagus clarus]